MTFLKKTIFSLSAQVPLSHLVVPILLAAGWIVGCALMVYIVFS
ncbi:sarcoplasmic/endoplasmic reticulum calcium ATPase regulator DWORF [Neopsephotus bourkii]|nr:sarcoplasmic/endoplasmic reticulum calcium ATPase regulator DWORF [Neopsephotus bourkii]